MDAIGQWNALFAAGRLTWMPVPVVLPPSTVAYLALVQSGGAALEMATQSPINGTYLFRVHGMPAVAYLLHDSAGDGRHIWTDEQFENVDPVAVGWLVAVRAVTNTVRE